MKTASSALAADPAFTGFSVARGQPYTRKLLAAVPTAGLDAVLVAADGEPSFPLRSDRRDYKTRSVTTLCAANPAILQHLQSAMVVREP